MITRIRKKLQLKRRELTARALNCFWLPCPLCGEMFGGHEWRDYDGKSSIIKDPVQRNSGVGICPACTKAGKGDDVWAVERG